MDDNLPAGERPRRGTVRVRRVGAAAAVGLGLTLGAAGIAAAASPAPSPSSGTPSQAAPHHSKADRDGRREGRREHGMAPRGAVRGEFVVPDGKGGWRTVQVQRGVASAVTATSMTVTSADGAAKTYLLTKDTKVRAGRGGTVASGDVVVVRATVTGGTATATHVVDLTKVGAKRHHRPQGSSPAGTPARPSSYQGTAVAIGA